MMLLVLWYVFVCLVGLTVGSFLNVCVGRLPYEKSLLWPGSRCNTCLQPIRWFDNIPLVGYLLLRGRCRTCGARIGPRVLVVELFTAVAFVALFHVEMVENWLGLPMIRQGGGLTPSQIPPEAVVVFAHHAILLSFLLAASLCDLSDMEIPLSITLWGTVIGLVMSCLLPWPLPESVRPVAANALPGGAYAWPVWYPLPEWLPAGSWRLGLTTGLAGALAGMAVLRAIRFLFNLGRGKEGLGVGDADLMMMAGAYIGWQPVVLAFFLSVFPALVFAIVKLIITRRQDLPFGPSLSLGVMITVLGWTKIGPLFQSLFFDPVFLGLMACAGAIALLAASFLLRLLRGTDKP